MSVKFHEGFCLDSAQDHFWWMDHFLGDQLQDEWRTAGTGSAVVVDQQTGGICRLTTGAINLNDYQIDWNDIRSLLVSKKCSMEFRLKLAQTTNTYCLLCLRFDANNSVAFLYATQIGHVNWHIRNTNNAANTDQNSGIATNTSYHVFRIECHTHDSNHIHYYIDGTECGGSPISTNVPDDATDYLQPFFYIQTRENAIKSMDIDYCAVRQDR